MIRALFFNATAALVATFIVFAQLTPGAEQTKQAISPSDVSVTVKYVGKGGTVDASHRIWVWLFETPDITSAAPIAELSIDKNGGTAAFTNVPAKAVYITIAYDEKGGFAGQAPPPPGSPVMIYGAKTAAGKPTPVTPGPREGAITVTLTDAQRMP